jgi:hypothetical protein
MAAINSVPLSRRYRARAEECQRIAEFFHSGETQLKLLRIAEDYDWMALRAAAIELQQADDGPLAKTQPDPGTLWPVPS